MKSLQMKSVLVLLVLIFMLIPVSLLAKDVTLSWDASPSNVTGYLVYYKIKYDNLPFDGTGADQGSSPIDVGNVLTFTLTGLLDNTLYYFAVTAYDSQSNESVYSNIVHSGDYFGGKLRHKNESGSGKASIGSGTSSGATIGRH